jgi:hypothetical protein
LNRRTAHTLRATLMQNEPLKGCLLPILQLLVFVVVLVLKL